MNPAASIDAVLKNNRFIQKYSNMQENYKISILTRWHAVPAASICAAG